MVVVQSEFTQGICTLTALGENQILSRHKNGSITLWKYEKPRRLVPIRTITSDGKEIQEMVAWGREKFITIHSDPSHERIPPEEFEIRVYAISHGRRESVFRMEGGSDLWTLDYSTMLPNGLLAVSGCYSHGVGWDSVEIWDLHSRTCRSLRERLNVRSRANGISLATTAEGYLVTAGHCSGELRIWNIDRSECRLIHDIEIGRIYSMAVLPTGEIVTGGFGLYFYRVYPQDEITEKTLSQAPATSWPDIENSNVIDEVFPIGGYQLLTVDRSNRCSGTLKLWNYISGECRVLGNSRIGASKVSYSHIVLEREGVVLSVSDNKVVIHSFSEDLFHFPKNLAEIRKNARLLAQARRTQSSCFSRLPPEISLRIVTLTGHPMNTYEKAVSELIARNNFSKPQVCAEIGEESND